MSEFPKIYIYIEQIINSCSSVVCVPTSYRFIGIRIPQPASICICVCTYHNSIEISTSESLFYFVRADSLATASVLFQAAYFIEIFVMFENDHCSLFPFSNQLIWLVYVAAQFKNSASINLISFGIHTASSMNHSILWCALT